MAEVVSVLLWLLLDSFSHQERHRLDASIIDSLLAVNEFCGALASLWAFGVQRSTFGVQRSAFGAQRSAFGV
jgi:hypothetical protein